MTRVDAGDNSCVASCGPVKVLESRKAELSRDSRTSIELVRAARAADEDSYWSFIEILHARGSEEEFELALKLSKSEASEDRRIAADILGQLGWEEKAYQDESVSRLIELLSDANPDVVYSAAIALSHREDERAIPPLLKLVRHPAVEARRGVVFALGGHRGDEVVAALMELSRDEDADVRNWATYGFGTLCDVDSSEIRQALFARTDDNDEEVRAEAIRGLLNRKAPQSLELVRRELERGCVGTLVLESAESLREKTLYRLLKDSRHLVPSDDANHLRCMADALAACSGIEDSELLTPELVEAILQDNFPVKNDTRNSDYVEELGELADFEINTVGQLRELLGTHRAQVLEVDRHATHDDPLYRHVYVRDYGEEYVVEKEQLGCWYALPRLLRFALEFQFGEAYEQFSDRRDHKDLDGESLVEEELFAVLQDAQSPASLDSIEEFELKVGCRLPPDYRHFLRRCNGGSLPSDWGYEFRSSDLPPDFREVRLVHLGGLRNEPELSLLHQFEQHKPLLPDDLLWIGDDGAGNAICIGVRGVRADRIYFWDRALATNDDERATVLIAPFFLQFLYRFKRRGT